MIDTSRFFAYLERIVGQSMISASLIEHGGIVDIRNVEMVDASVESDLFWLFVVVIIESSDEVGGVILCRAAEAYRFIRRDMVHLVVTTIVPSPRVYKIIKS